MVMRLNTTYDPGPMTEVETAIGEFADSAGALDRKKKTARPSVGEA